MNLHSHVSALVAVVAMGLAFAFTTRPANAQAVATEANTERARAATIAETASATVKAIDPATRTITLQKPDGEEVAFECGEKIQNFDQIKVGDVVRAAAIDRVAVSLSKGTDPGADAGVIAARAPAGAKPGMLICDTDEITAKVDAIDAEKRTVTLKGPEGRAMPITVGPDVNLTSIKTGDDVTVRATKGIAIWVEKPGEPQPAGAKIAAAGAIETVTATATVDAIDPAARTVTLKTPAGATKTIHLGKEVVNFDKIKVGDKVRATMAEGVALSIGKPGEQPKAEEGEAVALAAKGDKPGMIIVDSKLITGKIESVDAAKRTVTLSADGKSRTLKAGPKLDLSEIKPGEEVSVRATQGLALVLEKP